MEVSLTKEAKSPVYQMISELEPGDLFEMGGLYWGFCGGCRFKSKGSEVYRVNCVRLDTLESQLLPSDLRIKRVQAKIYLSEMEDA